MPSESNGTDWLPIREVTRQTGVHPVTLRAWERRYGLVVPHRTAKGHRLYDAAQVARIQQVLTWLNRGVAVSQVKQLLDAPQDAQPEARSDWQQLRQTLTRAIAEMAERQLDDLFNQAMALYPPATLCEQLLLPLLSELEQRWAGQFGAQMQRAFFHGWLRSKLGAPQTLTCGWAPGWSAAATARCRCSMYRCLPVSWPWLATHCARARCCCTPTKR
jgi:DNA-binding transcriptional MerR regulator